MVSLFGHKTVAYRDLLSCTFLWPNRVDCLVKKIQYRFLGSRPVVGKGIPLL